MKEAIKKFIQRASIKPGVYLWKRKDGRILYVGKANNLRNRLKNYLHPVDHKTELLVEQSDLIETIVTKTESEALILEDALVKQNQPRYNVRLRDDKRYPYLKITVAEEYPRIQIVRRVETDRSRYFGPFTDAGAVKRIRGLVVELFGIRTCNYDVRRLTRPCIKYSMGKCCAPYVVTPKNEYNTRVGQACKFLAGDYKKLKNEVKRGIKQESKKLNYERASELKNILDSLTAFAEPQDLASATLPDMDVLGYGAHKGKAAISQMKVRNHHVVAVLTFPLKGERVEDAEEALKSFINQTYTAEDTIPKLLYTSAEAEDKFLLEEKLKDISKNKVSIIRASRGQKHKLAQMAVEQSIHYLTQEEIEQDRESRSESLKIVLKLETSPQRIEGYDISNLGSKASVGGMVVFTNDKPDKSEYRRFKIRWKKGQDDPNNMAEVIQRRFNHPEWKFPDLVLLDGGKPQLNTCLPHIPAGIPVVALAKRDEEIFQPKKQNPIKLKKNHPGLLLLQEIRDEAHRYSKAYHTKRREREFLD